MRWNSSVSVSLSNAETVLVTALAQHFHGTDCESFEVLLQQAAMVPEASRGIAFVKMS
jgi:hypothetical protein